jgi:hypothetical protein
MEFSAGKSLPHKKMYEKLAPGEILDYLFMDGLDFFLKSYHPILWWDSISQPIIS